MWSEILVKNFVQKMAFNLSGSVFTTAKTSSLSSTRTFMNWSKTITILTSSLSQRSKSKPHKSQCPKPVTLSLIDPKSPTTKTLIQPHSTFFLMTIIPALLTLLLNHRLLYREKHRKSWATQNLCGKAVKSKSRLSRSKLTSPLKTSKMSLTT